VIAATLRNRSASPRRPSRSHVGSVVSRGGSDSENLAVFSDDREVGV
jgi:hypothetical protein